MSNKSGVSKQVIDLPQGGGALKSLGEKFAPDLHTGTGNFSIPLALPPGRNNLTPQLNLAYSTGVGNGPFGLGWSIGLPSLTRKTSKGVPHYNDANDVFILSGAEDLVPVSGATGVTRYRPRTEGLFARIEHCQTIGSDFWKVWSKNGLLSFYGSQRPDNANDSWLDPAALIHSEQPHKIFAWKLTQTVDRFDNRIEYLYERDAAQIYLSEVRYADHGNPSDHRFLVTVKFHYEMRPDPFSDHRAGFEVRTRKRCVRMEIWTHPETDILASVVQFDYLPEDRLPLNRISLLHKIRLEGRDGRKSESFPPLEFTYTPFQPSLRRYQAVPASHDNGPARSVGHTDYELVDLFGNGLPDVVEMNVVSRYWRNRGGAFDAPRTMQESPVGVHLADAGVQMADFNGDGRTELLVSNTLGGGYYPLSLKGGWDQRGFVRYERAPSFDLENAEVKFFDFGGGGVIDLLRTGEQFEFFLNDPTAGWTKTETRRRLEDLDEFPNVRFSDPRVRLADMTGDGLQDIVLIQNGRVDYWPYLAYGRWGHRVTMNHSPRFDEFEIYPGLSFDPKRLLLGDVDGDGVADLVYVGPGQVTVWINQSGNGWSAPVTIYGTPPITDMDAIRLVDMLGQGVAGILWSYDHGVFPDSDYKFLDLTGGLKPYLLNRMDNHRGAVTAVEYAPSTGFYLEDEKNPDTRWKTSLPFPVQVVAKVTVEDVFSKSKLTSEYRYHHGHWDGEEREFRGFGRVEQFDAEVFPSASDATGRFYSPPTKTVTWFHLGAISQAPGDWRETDFQNEYWPEDPPVFERPATLTRLLESLSPRDRRDALRALRGSVLRTELYALDGAARQDRPYTVAESLNSLREESAPSANETRQRIFFPHQLARRITQWERGTDPMTTFEFTDDFDSYGQPRSQIKAGVPRSRDFKSAVPSSEPYLATQSVTTYAQKDDSTSYMADRVSSVTGFEILNDGRSPLFDLIRTVNAGQVSRRLIGHSIHFYDGPAFHGLAFGQLGAYGAIVRTETLVLTEEILNEAYKSGDQVLSPPERPPYLVTNGSPDWTGYPDEFRALLVQSSTDDTRPGLQIVPAGYGFAEGASSSPFVRGFYSAAERRQYDFQVDSIGTGRGVLTALRDALGRDTTIDHDQFQLLPVTVTDPVGLTIRADYDYRVFQPREFRDANGNRSFYRFTALGLLSRKFLIGRDGEGDTEEEPSIRFEYDFSAYVDRGEPVCVRTVQRVHHASENDPDDDKRIETVEYSDGFGRAVQTRNQAEDSVFGDQTRGDAGLKADPSDEISAAVGREQTDPPHVAVTGWKKYDNKGRVVEKFEPCFSDGWGYAALEFGQKTETYYDPRGLVIRTVNPDKSERSVVNGVPGTISQPDLTNPTMFEPTPWEGYTYDGNDNAGRTHAALSEKYKHHWNTPASVLADAFSRTVQSVARNGTNSSDWHTTRFRYDIQGRLGKVTDPLGRSASRQLYDVVGNVLRVDSIDSGWHRTVLDAAGNVLESQDAKGALTLNAYDPLDRPCRLWARDAVGEPLNLMERTEYGDGGTAQQPANERDAQRTLNRLGRLYRHYDEAGRVTLEKYDFKGNLLDRTRQVVKDSKILSVFQAAEFDYWRVRPFRTDWRPPFGTTLEQHAEDLLASITFRTSSEYDALNRAKKLVLPQDVTGARKEITPRFNAAGMLESVTLDGVPYVRHIAYNAASQRILIAFGNGLMTRYVYHPETFRLQRLRTERNEIPSGQDHTYRPTNIERPLQDFFYDYDLVGNILQIANRSPESGFPNNPDTLLVPDGTVLARLLVEGNALIRRFDYDPLSRLLSATGREHAVPLDDLPWTTSVRSQDMTLARGYKQTYQYDAVGNIKELGHQATDGNFTRRFSSRTGSNRLDEMQVGSSVYRYAYDPAGNQTSEGDARHFEWDHANRLKVYRAQTRAAGSAPEEDRWSEPSVYVHYLYDGAGQRVKKLERTQGEAVVQATVYLDGFEYRRRVEGTTVKENNTLHVMDGEKRIALIRVGEPMGDETPAIQYQFGDHLGSSHTVVDDVGTFVSREEQTPYGETGFGSYEKKRYRLQGKERDEESGLYYFGARYYAPWLARWTTCDPIGIKGGVNLYLYASVNPINRRDSNGTEDKGWWQTTKEGIGAAQGWFHEQGMQAGDIHLQRAEAFVSAFKLENTFLEKVIKGVAVARATVEATAVEFAGGVVMLGPNLLMLPEALRQVPQNLGEGAAKVKIGAETANLEMALEGVAQASGAVGTVAGTIAMAAGGVRGARHLARDRAMLQMAKESAAEVGPGKGPRHGTAVHSALERRIDAQASSGLVAEESFRKGVNASRGVRGSVRPDALTNPAAPEPFYDPRAGYDLKTGRASFNEAMAERWTSNLPETYEGARFAEIHVDAGGNVSCRLVRPDVRLSRAGVGGWIGTVGAEKRSQE